MMIKKINKIIGKNLMKLSRPAKVIRGLPASNGMKSKIIAIVLGISVLSSVLPIGHNQAKAAVPVIETNASLLAAETGTNITTAESLIQDIYEWVQSFVISALKKQLLDVLVDQIITYIQGGGKPQFVTDWKGFLEGAGQRVAGDFAQEIGLGFLCQPFNFQIQIALLPVPKFSQQSSCTLDQIVGNIENFYRDFRSGGWIAYSTAWEPQNNFLGALLLGTYELEIRKGAAQSAAYAEAQSGGGFLGARDSFGNIITPGSTNQDITSKAVGSDIDYILSAEQLSDYAAAIASALINRMITEGIAQVQDSGTSGTDTASQYQNIISNNFAFQQNVINNQIDRTLVPRNEARTIIENTIAVLNQYQTDLQNLFSQFDSLGQAFCQPAFFNQQLIDVEATKQAISDEIAWASSEIAILSSDLLETQAIITQLTAAQAEINTLSNDNSGLIRLTEISNEVSSVLDPTGAVTFKSAIEAKAEEVDFIINGVPPEIGSPTIGTIADFNQKLAQCQN